MFRLLPLVCAASALLVVSPSYAVLVGHWEFDSAADLGLDSAGGDNNGTGGADATFSASSRVGAGALAVDGSGTGLQLAGSDVFHPLTTFTIAGFFNADLDHPNFGGTGTSIAGRLFGALSTPLGGANDGYGFGVLDDGRLRYTTYGVQDYNQAATIAADTWNHAAVVVTEGSAEFFLNGTSLGTVAGENPTATTHPFHIGASGIGQSDNFVGLIDDLRVYDESRGAADIAALAAIPEPGSIALAGLGAVIVLGVGGRRRV